MLQDDGKELSWMAEIEARRKKSENQLSKNKEEMKYLLRNSQNKKADRQELKLIIKIKFKKKSKKNN